MILADWGLVGTGIVGVKITLFMVLLGVLGISLGAVLAEKGIRALWRMWKDKSKGDRKAAGIWIRLFKEGTIDEERLAAELRKLGLTEEEIRLLIRLAKRDRNKLGN